MSQTKTDLHVTTMEAAEDALAYARTAMLPAFSVTYTPKIPFPTNREDLRQSLNYTLAPYSGMLRLQELMGEIYQQAVGTFSAAQQRAYEGNCQMYTFVRKSQLDAAVDYFTSAKDTNDLICVAAEIGTKLRAQLGDRPTVQRIIHVYQKWINATFRYENTGRPEDHSAFALMRDRTGVCQAIAALTVLVLPYLGLHTQYIAGQGGGREGLGPHAWNLIRVPAVGNDPALEDQLQWYHVDFTFGMNGVTPHTLNPRSAMAFATTHVWDEELSQTYLNHCRHKELAMRCAEIVLRENKDSWQLGDISVTTPRPMLVGNDQQGHWIDLFTLLRFLGGGCEYIAHENRLRICLNDRQYLVDNGRYYLDGPGGYLKVSILRHLPVQIFARGNAYSMKVVNV